MGGAGRRLTGSLAQLRHKAEQLTGRRGGFSSCEQGLDGTQVDRVAAAGSTLHRKQKEKKAAGLPEGCVGEPAILGQHKGDQDRKQHQGRSEPVGQAGRQAGRPGWWWVGGWVGWGWGAGAGRQQDGFTRQPAADARWQVTENRRAPPISGQPLAAQAGDAVGRSAEPCSHAA